MDMHDRVVAANREWYRLISADYATYRASDQFLNHYESQFLSDFDRMRLPQRASVLDCCAGTGLLSKLFAERGCEVVALDVSPEMLSHIDGVTTVEADVLQYLRDPGPTFDCVAFGSALHHLWDYGMVLELAMERLRHGGVVYAVREPIRQKHPVGRAARELEFVWRKVKGNPRDILPAVRRRLGFRRSTTLTDGRETGDLVGLFAEAHAHGVSLERVIAAVGEPEMLRVDRTGPGWMRAAKRVVPGYTSDQFTLIARRRK